MKRKKTLNQKQMPYVWAVSDYIKEKRVPFHMPGHKQGKGINRTLRKLWGNKVFLYDLTEVDGLDYINAPEGVIKTAETLAAKAFNVKYTYFLINGSTVGNQAAMLSSVHERDKIVIPRNAHQSTYSGLILSGAQPVYVSPTLHKKSGLYPVVGLNAITTALERHADIKAVHITSPTHCGFTSAISKIRNATNKKGLVLIADEAHGSHFIFHPDLPKSAIFSKADLVIQSTHKTLGSLTQTSMLHLVKSDKVSTEEIQKILRLLQSSSPSTLLVMSLDAARQQMAVDGKKLLTNTLNLARYARNQINTISGFFCYGKEVINTDDIDDIDETKLLIDVSQSGYTGTKLDKILGREYKIEVEMSDQKNILCFITIGDSERSVEKLLNALRSLPKRKTAKLRDDYIVPEIPQIPDLVLLPREAFFAKKKQVSLEKAAGEVSGEFIIPFPPDIPILAPGERITKDIVNNARHLKKKGAKVIGLKDTGLENIEVIKDEKKH